MRQHSSLPHNKAEERVVHILLASPFLNEHVVLRPGSSQGLKIPRAKYEELEQTVKSGGVVPKWLVDAANHRWSIDLSDMPVSKTVLVRRTSVYGFARASYELNLGCNYDCEHCYLGLKRFEGLRWPERERLLNIMCDAGVLWLQLTGGEPLIDKLFPEVYSLAHELGMMISILTNGSRLWSPRILELLTTMRPYRVTISVYGATEASYDSLTRRKGSFRLFVKGIAAGCEAGLPINLSGIVTTHNAHEAGAMRAMAEERGLPYQEYSNISPTIYSGAESLPSQAASHVRNRKPFTGCNAGHTHFHADPHGKASICKVGRDQNIDLIAEGVEGLRGLGAIADSLMLRTGGCSGCALSGSCGTCRPLAKLYQEANAPLHTYCQHGRR